MLSDMKVSLWTVHYLNLKYRIFLIIFNECLDVKLQMHILKVCETFFKVFLFTLPVARAQKDSEETGSGRSSSLCSCTSAQNHFH